MTQIKTFYFNDLRECTYLLWDETGEAVIVDPGCNSDSEKQRLVKYVEDNNLKPIKILQTHGHFDHIMGNAFVSKKWGIKTYIHPGDKGLLVRAKEFSQMFGYNIESPPTDTIDLEEGTTVNFGNTVLHIIHTPGHTPGGVCFYSKAENNKFVLTGDTLFAGSIGRTDLPGGDYDQLMESLLGKLIVIGEEYRVLPGHGPETTIGEEHLTFCKRF